MYTIDVYNAPQDTDEYDLGTIGSDAQCNTGDTRCRGVSIK
jgi:hypothetical protein